MPCDSRLRQGQTLANRIDEVKRAQAKLEALLRAKSVKVAIAPNGAVAFTGWKKEDRSGLSDACIYRTLSAAGSWELRQAVARAQAETGRVVNPQAVAAGWHSHDDGKTFGRD